MAAEAAVVTIRKSMPGASDEKLAEHLEKVTQAILMTDDRRAVRDFYKLE